MSKTGHIEQDIIALITWKKASKEERKNMVCNQLSMVDDFIFHEFWWKTNINQELYWELQYEWLDNSYFNKGVFMERIWRAIKKFNFTRAMYIYARYLLWEEIVKINYQLYVKLPYQIRNGTSI